MSQKICTSDFQQRKKIPPFSFPRPQSRCSYVDIAAHILCSPPWAIQVGTQQQTWVRWRESDWGKLAWRNWARWLQLAETEGQTYRPILGDSFLRMPLRTRGILKTCKICHFLLIGDSSCVRTRLKPIHDFFSWNFCTIFDIFWQLQFTTVV